MRIALAAALLCFSSIASASHTAPRVEDKIALPDGGWDLLAVDPASGRVLIARGDGVDAVNIRTGAVTPHFVAGDHFHGVVLVPGTPLGVATQAAGSAVIFDARSGKISKMLPTDPDADAVVYEPATRTVWVMNGDSGTISIVDPVQARVMGKLTIGGSLEMGALDGRGHLFINVADKGEIAKISIASKKVVKTVKLPDCEHPTGLAYVRSGLLLSACANGVADLTRASDGRPAGHIAIGPRPDGAFADPARQRAYIPSGGDGTLTVIDTCGRQPRKLVTVETQVGARTGTVNPATGAVFLPAATYGASPAPGTRPSITPGSVKLLVVK